MPSFQRILAFLLCYCCWSADSKKATSSVDRSYQLASVPLGHGAQGLQYYASGSPGLIYPSVPATVYIPGQVGVLNLPSSTDSPPSFHSSYPSFPSSRPSYPRQQQGAASFSIEQSVDLTDSPSLPPVGSTYGPPKALEVAHRRPHGSSNHHRTYHRYKGHPYASRGGRPSSRPMVYTHLHKGHLHTHYIPPSGTNYKSQKPTYLPPSTTQAPLPPPTTESSAHLSYNHHAHPGNAQSSSVGNLVRFPGGSSQGEITQALIGQQGIINNYDANLPIKIPKPKPNQLEVKEILKNADLHFVDVFENLPTTASPLQHLSYQYKHQQQYQAPQQQVPQQQYQVSQQQAPQQPYQLQQNFASFPVSQFYQPQQQQEQPGFTFSFHEDSQQNQQHQHQQPIRSYAELYDHRFQASQAYQNNHLEQDSGSSETVKVPVAIYKGVFPGGMFPVERSDEDSSESAPADFTPSKSTSDWIPVTGGVANQKPETVRNLNQFGDDYFADLSKQSPTSQESRKSYPTKKSTDKFFIDPSTSNGHQNFPIAQKLSSSRPDEPIYGSSKGYKQSSFRSETKKSEKVGDIISGRIPGDHNPFGTIGGERDRRKGNVIEAGSSTSTGKIGDGSNLVVSSVIKFSR